MRSEQACPGCDRVFTVKERVPFMVHLTQEHGLDRHEAIALVKEGLPIRDDSALIKRLQINFSLTREEAQLAIKIVREMSGENT